MGIIEFFVLVLIVVAAGALTLWAIKRFGSEPPPAIVINIVWFVVVLIIIVALARALGLTGADPQIPRLR